LSSIKRQQKLTSTFSLLSQSRLTNLTHIFNISNKKKKVFEGKKIVKVMNTQFELIILVLLTRAMVTGKIEKRHLDAKKDDENGTMEINQMKYKKRYLLE
jgi:hypothetical protein